MSLQNYEDKKAVKIKLENACVLGSTTAIVTLASIGKLLNCIAYQLCFLHTTEIYSTSIRSMGMNTNSAVARIGSTLAAYVGLLVSNERTATLHCKILVVIHDSGSLNILEVEVVNNTGMGI